jgi:glycosyltransferase involved in cell wall biosynthesis
MRVLQVTEASGSGTLQIVLTLASALAQAGDEVHVACGRRPETPGDLGAALPAGVALHDLGWEARTPAQQLRAGRRLRRLARRLDPDVVHLHSAFAGLVGAVALPRAIPVIYTPHASPLARGGRRAARLAALLAERTAARRSDLIGAVSEAEAELMRARTRARDVRVIPNGIPELDPGAEPGAGERVARPLVVAIGRIGPQRRPAEVAEILASVRDLADVAWIGAAPAGQDRPLREAGIDVTGWLPREQALERLGAATACLHWSAWDGQSVALLEALARDVVVVGSDIAANREVLGERQVRDTAAGASRLLRDVLTDERLRAELLGAQRTRRGDHGAARMAAGWMRAYADVLAPPVHHAVHADGGGVPKIEVPWS